MVKARKAKALPGKGSARVRVARQRQLWPRGSFRWRWSRLLRWCFREGSSASEGNGQWKVTRLSGGSGRGGGIVAGSASHGSSCWGGGLVRAQAAVSLLVAFLLTSCSHALQVRDQFRRIRTREADELLIAPDRPAASLSTARL